MADRLRPGATARLEHRFTPDDIAAFVRLSGDDNPIHLQASAARAAGFEREIVHGVLVLSLISRILGTDLPGAGTILLGQEIRYLYPVYVGDRVRASVEILTVRDDKPIIGLRTWVETDRLALDGQATVLVRPVGQLPSEPSPEVAT